MIAIGPPGLDYPAQLTYGLLDFHGVLERFGGIGAIEGIACERHLAQGAGDRVGMPAGTNRSIASDISSPKNSAVGSCCL